MQIDFELNDMFSYSFLILIPFFIVFILFIFLFIFLFINKKNKNISNNCTIINKKDLNEIKNRYLYNLYLISEKLSKDSINSRVAYQRLSKTIRNFIYETTNIRVQNYTLKEIELLNMPILYELVKEYYNPEFCKVSKGNITNSINKTRMVIERWN